MIKRLSADLRLHVLFLHILAVIILELLACLKGPGPCLQDTDSGRHGCTASCQADGELRHSGHVVKIRTVIIIYRLCGSVLKQK